MTMNQKIISKGTGFKRFVDGIQFQPFTYDYTINTIRSIFPLSGPYFLILDTNFNLHLVKNKHVISSENFPIPSYAITKNRNVLYTIEVASLFEKVYNKKIQSLDLQILHKMLHENTTYRQDIFSNIIPYTTDKFIIQVSEKFSPFIVDLKNPEKIAILPKLSKPTLISKGPGNTILYMSTSNKKCFIYYPYLQKTRQIHFKTFRDDYYFEPLSFRALGYIKEGNIVLETDQFIQIVSLKTNKLIKHIVIQDAGLVTYNTTRDKMFYFTFDSLIHLIEFEDEINFREKKFFLPESEIYADPCFLGNDHIIYNAVDFFHIWRIDDLNLEPVAQIPLPWGSRKIDRGTDYINRDAQQFNFQIFQGRGLEFLGVRKISNEKIGGKSFLQSVSHFKVEYQGDKTDAYKLVQNEASEKKPVVKFVEIFSEVKDSAACVTLTLDKTKAYMITHSGKLYQIELASNALSFLVAIDPFTEFLKGDWSKNALVSHLFNCEFDDDCLIIGLTLNSSKKIELFNFDVSNFTMTRVHYSYEYYDIIQKSTGSLISIYEDQMHIVIGTLYYQEFEELYSNEDEIKFRRIWEVTPGLYMLSDFVQQIYFFNSAFEYIKGPVYFKQFFKIQEEFTEEVSIETRPVKEGIYIVSLTHKGIYYAVMHYTALVNLIPAYSANLYSFRLRDLLLFAGHEAIGGLKLLGCDKLYNKHDGRTRFGFEDKNFMYALDFKACCALKENDMFIGYEVGQYNNQLCIFRRVNPRLEMLKLLKDVMGNIYHGYVLKMVVDSLGIKNYPTMLK